MISEPFATGDSVIHRLDPRLRIIFAIAYSLVVAVSNRYEALVPALLASLVMVGLARLPWRLFVKRVLLVNTFMFLLWVVLPLTGKGESRLVIWETVAVSRQGAALALMITLKSNAIIFVLIGLISTMSFASLGQALRHLHTPEKLVNLFLLTYRYVFVIEQEYFRIMRALKIRGFVPRTSLHTYKTYAYVVGMLFVRASERAERVYDAMRCRGFRGRFYSLREFQPWAGNWVFAITMTVVTISLGLVASGWWSYG